MDRLSLITRDLPDGPTAKLITAIHCPEPVCA